MFVVLLAALPINALRIAFGSCAGAVDLKNPQIWTSIAQWKPHTFIWLGDVVYADRMLFPFVFTPSPREVWEAKYRDRLSEPTYQALANSTRILEVWDDHDYGMDNADSSVAYKELSRELFLDFLGESKTSPRRTNPGINASYEFSEQGHTVRVILLDNRSFLHKKQRIFFGQHQLDWLKTELSYKADVYLIMAGTQFLMQDCVDGGSESVYDHELKQIFDIVRTNKE